ncbi:MAG: DUF3857 domain-containing protein [Rhodothermales bacterium]
MKRFSIFWMTGLIALVLTGSAAAQGFPPDFDETFAVSSLNPLLMLKADAVVRLDLLHFEVSNPGRAVRKVRRVVTVLNADGREAGEFLVQYDDRLRHLKKLRGLIRNAQGKVIRKLKKDDIGDYSAISGYSLYDDNRVRVAQLYHDTYPYTVEFEYEILHDGLISWPTWYPQYKGLPVEYGRYVVEAPSNLEMRYHVHGAELEPDVFTRGKRKTLSWNVSALSALDLEPFSPSWEEQVIAVYTAPAAFEIEGARGKMDSWQAFGRWYRALSVGRTELPPEARREVQQLVAGLTDPREKVRRLYEYLQQKTRYVNISLGLGGWQPFDATYVYERGYGDCKALTNYMLALLEEADIPSFPALIRSGGRAPEVLPNFPSNQFDHVILSVPLAADTVWLECTNQAKAFGHLGTFTEDRYALLVTPEGGELVRTPRSRAHENQQTRRAHVDLASSGSATATVHTRYTGNQQDDVRQNLVLRSGQERKEWLLENIDIGSFELVNVDFSEVDAKRLSFELSFQLKLPSYAARTGKRFFLPVNLLGRWSYIPPKVEERTQPVAFFPYAFVDTDTIRYTLPEGVTVEAMPELVEAETSFGRYRAEVVLEADGTLAYHRLLEITKATFPAEEYDAFRDFMRQISQADRAQVVLVKQ